MRLLVITNDFPPTVGGIENYIYSLVRRWPTDEVVVVTRRVDGDEQFDMSESFEVIREPVDVLMPTPDFVRRMLKLVSDSAIDIVHFPSTLPLALMGPGLGRPYALSVHGGEYRLASRIPAVRSVLKAVSRRAGVILAQSSFAESLVTDLLGPSAPMTRVTCGVDSERHGRQAAAAVDLGVQGPVVVSVSRLVPRKGPRTLVDAFPGVIKQHPNAHLVIVGGGPDLDLLRSRVARTGLSESVTLAGPQPWDRIPSYMAAADIFALPTRNRFLGTETEGLPLVYVEAAAAGLPLIGGDAGGVCDAVRPGETGILVDGSSPEQTAAAINRLLNNPEEARKLGEAARKMAVSEFNWDTIYSRYRRALQQIC